MSGAFAVNFAVDKGLRQSRDDEFSTWNDIFDSTNNSDVIILGNSRAWEHISPEILDSVLHINSYNLGINGYPFSMQYTRFKLFEKYNKKPSLVIQSVDFLKTLHQATMYNKGQFTPYTYDNLLRDELKKIGFTNAEFHIPAWKYLFAYPTIIRGLKEYQYLNWLPGGSDPTRYKGYAGLDGNWDPTEMNKVLRDSIVVSVNPEVVALFDAFLNYCKGNSIQVILVFTPQYIKMSEFTQNWDGEMRVYHDFAEKYDIPFLDYTHDPICYDTTYFFNATHLNKKGAELFSLQLANDIKEQNLYKYEDCESPQEPLKFIVREKLLQKE
ncbi:hypothetical protein FACS1894199_17110 [Bacteroidia bacterium]|nr:hypothetical protein FACS1894199_17110 [Bacteroidia bacterium]